jgi:hypothetical protein
MQGGWHIGRAQRTRVFVALAVLLLAAIPTAAAALTDARAARGAGKDHGQSANGEQHQSDHPTSGAHDQPSHGSPGTPPGHGTVWPASTRPRRG